MILFSVEFKRPRADDDENDENVFRIGIYSTRTKAEESVERLKAQPGFTDHPEGFEIHQVIVDVTFWEEGFISGYDFPQSPRVSSTKDGTPGSIPQMIVHRIDKQLHETGLEHPELWTDVRSKLNDGGRRLEVSVTMRHDDAFDPAALNRMLDTIERIIGQHIPDGIPIGHDYESWSVVVNTKTGDLVDVMAGGKKQAGRTGRMSDQFGLPLR